MTTVQISKCCREDVYESHRDNPQDHHSPIEIYRCAKCDKECTESEILEVCEGCRGSGEVPVMEQVYQNEPHEALTGSQPCADCLV